MCQMRFDRQKERKLPPTAPPLKPSDRFWANKRTSIRARYEGRHGVGFADFHDFCAERLRRADSGHPATAIKPPETTLSCRSMLVRELPSAQLWVSGLGWWCPAVPR
jgi:hypothetical protein